MLLLHVMTSHRLAIRCPHLWLSELFCCFIAIVRETKQRATVVQPVVLWPVFVQRTQTCHSHAAADIQRSILCVQLVACGRLQCWWRGIRSSEMLHVVAADLTHPDVSKAIRIFGNEGASLLRNVGTCKQCHVRQEQGPNWLDRPNVTEELV